MELTKQQKEKASIQAKKIRAYRKSIRLYIKDRWGLTPQKIKPTYKKRWEEAIATTGEEWEKVKTTITGDWFGDPVDTEWRGGEWVWYDPEGPIHNREEFLKHKYFSWQQNLTLIGIEKAVSGNASNLISVVSGHGIGKSSECSWIILWFLECWLNSQIAVTAPTSHQMHDVLWKELSIWINKMPEEDAQIFEWTADYVRIKYARGEWFARARTSTKENTEAIAGVHSSSGVAIVVDEASGVPNQVFDTAEGAITSGKVLFVMISNGTQNTGYFYDSHHKDRSMWQNFCFNGEESPLVDRKYIKLKAKHGLKSEEYGIRVRGTFPGESAMDTTGYLQLLSLPRIHIRIQDEYEIPFLNRIILGIDPSGEGKDAATMVIRDPFKMKKIYERQSSNPRQIAEDALTFISEYHIDQKDVVCDSFGIGADVGKEIAVASGGKINIYTVLLGNTPKEEANYNQDYFIRTPEEVQNPEENEDKWIDMYLNLRALAYFRLRAWCIAGGQVVDISVDNSPFANEISVIKYKRTLQGNKIQIMPKKDMLKLGIKSPNIADAGMLTMLRPHYVVIGQSKEQMEAIEKENSEYYDKYSSV